MDAGLPTFAKEKTRQNRNEPVITDSEDAGEQDEGKGLSFSGNTIGVIVFPVEDLAFPSLTSADRGDIPW